MFSMLNKTKKVKKSRNVASQSASSTKAAGKRRTRSASSESASDANPAEDGPSERKKVKTDTSAATEDPMEALESNAGAAVGDETMDDIERGDRTDAGDVTVDIELPSESSKPMPVVTDDFEQEAEREVAATSGFAKVEEGEKMRLVHQVRHQVSYLTCRSL